MGRFLLHSGSFHLARKGKASAIRSTGCHGGTRREVSQIERGIAVPVMDRTARLARPLPIRQRQASMYVLTIGTHTTGWKPTIRYGNAGGVHGCFVVQLPPELESADISNGKGQAVVCHHAAHIQVFDTDDAELTNNLCRCLVQRVLPDIGDARMQASKSHCRLPAVRRSLRLAAMGTATPAQYLQAPPQCLGAFDDGAIAQGRQSLHAEINAADRLGFADWWNVIDFDTQADEPAIRYARNDGGFDVPDEPDGFAHLDPADDRQLDPLAINLNRVGVRLIRAGISAETVACNSFLLELRVFGASLKEVLEGGAKVLDGLLWCVFRHFQHPREGIVLDRVQRTAQGHL